MTLEEHARLNHVADILVCVSGAIMQEAASQPEEHDESCTCRLCRAFVSAQWCIGEIERILKGQPTGDAP